MTIKAAHQELKNYVKNCAYCYANFYAKRDSGIFCSNTCRQKFYLMKKAHIKNGYPENPNLGIQLPPGTIPSHEMAEEMLIFQGNLLEIYEELKKYLAPHDLIREIDCAQNLNPFNMTLDWNESHFQIFSGNDYIEIFRIHPKIFKIYKDLAGFD